MDVRSLDECFDFLSCESRELYLDKRVPILQHIPSPLEFYRNYVSTNKPVVIRGAVDHWPAVHSWTNDNLRGRIGNTDVTVAVTPDGYADAVSEGRFMKPAEKLMQFNDFLDILEKKRRIEGIAYIQRQNSNFTDEFGKLAKDVEMDLKWATEAFGSPPDAVNFWMGDENAVTSMHKDHYENIYCVVSGQKTFLLIPPTDLPYVPYEQYKSGVYVEHDNGSFSVTEENDVTVPWIAIDPLCPDLVRYPQFGKACPIEVTVRAGDALYLPSLWFHHVRQSHGCIAVNFWYDMSYDIRYSYYKFVETLIEARGDRNNSGERTLMNHGPTVGDNLCILSEQH